MSLDMHALPITVLRNAAVEPGLPYCWCGANGVGVVRDGQTSCCKHKHTYCYELAMAGRCSRCLLMLNHSTEDLKLQLKSCRSRCPWCWTPTIRPSPRSVGAIQLHFTASRLPPPLVQFRFRPLPQLAASCHHQIHQADISCATLSTALLFSQVSVQPW
jgi:hypothetical protein